MHLIYKVAFEKYLAFKKNKIKVFVKKKGNYIFCE
jgi:hypothetical protein